jgi:uncharacterized protein (UPF0261 family)
MPQQEAGDIMPDARTVIVMGTLDTKGAELHYLAQQVEACGCRARLMDISAHGQSSFAADISAAAVVAALGRDINEVRSLPRGEAVQILSEAAAALLSRLVATGEAHGVIGLGGSGGTTICAAAMRGLPYGVPKIVVSTLASGNTRWHVGDSDLILMPSIMDLGGLNPLLEMVLRNAAGAINGMANAYRTYQPSGKKVICFTMYGTTTPGVTGAVQAMQQAGYETWIFHASGSGGQTMEKLMRMGYVAAVMDMTLAEIGAHLVGGLHDAGPQRLATAGELGLPQVIVPGAADTIVLPPRDQVPEKFCRRTLNFHNPTMTTMRTTAEENAAIGRFIAGKLNAARGPVTVVLPHGGLSSIDRPGKVFYDPAANQALFDTLKAELRPALRIVESGYHIDDPQFALLTAACMKELLTGSQRPLCSGAQTLT